MRILVVEDNAALADNFAELLRMEEIASEVVTRADAALEFLTQATGHDFDVLLSDHRLPSMSGLELVKELAKSGPVIPTILMTASTDPELEREAKAFGVFALLYKPVKIERLLQALRDSQAARLPRSSGGA